MAAGLGSRYGGNKQVDGIGPNHEILMEYSIYDALRSGFNKIVFVIKPDMGPLMDRICGEYLRRRTALDGQPVEVVYVYQDFTNKTPADYRVPEGRTKPLGTGQAVLCAEDAVHEPFCVIHADDYYGIDAYQTIYDELVRLPERGKATMVGYLLKNTASLNGTVTRGVCTVADGKLDSIHETMKIQLYPDGHLRDLAEDRELAPDTVVSMNYWGFTPAFFPELKRMFDAFLRGEGGRSQTQEFLLPETVGQLLRSGDMEVSVLHSNARWFGMTYREDKAAVAQELKKLHQCGQYPATLKD